MKYFICIILFTSIFSLPESKLSTIYSMLNTKQGYELKYFNGENNHRVDYMKYSQDIGKRGSILISVGNRQTSLEYLEMAYDLKKMGFSPIYVTSHRGQGFSDRELEDRRKGHIDSFEYYAKDLNTLSHIIKKEIGIKALLYNISHSMGGAVTLDYLQRFNSVFDKVILSAPMLKIRKDENNILFQTILACYTPFGPSCDDFIPGRGGIEKRDFSKNIVTSSKARYDLRSHFINLYPNQRLGGPTIGWIMESIKANKKMRNRIQLKRVKTPILIIQAEKDQVVVNKAQDEVCSNLKDCELIQIKEAMHDMPMERDLIRNQFLSEIEKYFY